MPQQQGATATTQQQQQKQQEQLAQPANTATSTNNTSNRQAAAVLTQQLCVALMRAGVPSSRRQMEEAACRYRAKCYCVCRPVCVWEGSCSCIVSTQLRLVLLSVCMLTDS